MSAKRKNVVRFDLPVNPAFEQRLARESDIDFTLCLRTDPEESAWAALSRAHVYHVSATKDELPRRWFVSAELLARCPGLLCVSSAGAGYDTVDVAACTQAGVAVVNQAGGNANSVAEHAFGLMLALSRRIVECNRRLRQETGFSREDVMGHELGGKVLGIIGIGHVGTRTAALARAFGMTVVATDPYLTDEEISRRGAEPAALDDLLDRSDIVSLHCPRAKDTLGMIDARALQRMKRGALFITTARGGIHDETALLAALQSGHIAGAGLDVWDKEPPPLAHPLLKFENVIASYHTAGVTHEARRNMAAIAAEQIVGVLKGGRPPRLINPEVWPAYAARYAAVLGAQVQVLDSE
ncbi:MAG: hydroxyacid dehydrogenase [Burkholderiales bacterium]|nr:hydroxyacid dehydrogenase [Burkholderiales bacterium]